MKECVERWSVPGEGSGMDLRGVSQARKKWMRLEGGEVKWKTVWGCGVCLREGVE